MTQWLILAAIAALWLILAAVVAFGFYISRELHFLCDEVFNWRVRSAASFKEIDSNLDVITAYARRRHVRDSMLDPK